MKNTRMQEAMKRGSFVSIILAIFLAGCGGTGEPADVKKASASAEDPDVYRPKTALPTPRPPTPSNKVSSSQKQPGQSDPDAFVPVGSPPQPAISQEKSRKDTQGSLASFLTGASSASAARPPQNGGSSYDPDAYVPETVRRGPASKSSFAANGKVISALDLKSRLRLYQSDDAEIATRQALEKELIITGETALCTLLEFNCPHIEGQSKKSEWLKEAGSQLWSSPFIDFLGLEHQTMATLGQRPTAVALAALIPNSAMRADLRRSLSRHWPEGPKIFLASAASECPLVEPGFIVALKSLIRENRLRSSAKPRPAKQAGSNPEAERIREETLEANSNAEWKKLLNSLVRDYCKHCHLAYLARTADAYRNGGTPAKNIVRNDSSVTPLPGCKLTASHYIRWPGVSASRAPQGAENGLTLEYQRFEKRMKLSKPLTYYRRQAESILENTMPDGLWLDGFVERNAEPIARSVDVLITGSDLRANKSASKEQELTVEILCITVGKTRE